MKKTLCFFFLVLGLQFITWQVSAQCGAHNIPYGESFHLISTNNQLPTCWAASNPSVTCLTYTSLPACSVSNPGYGAFFNNPQGANYFYSRAVNLKAGITYSTILWYWTDPSMAPNWSGLSIQYGPSQSTTGLIPVASISGTVGSPCPTPLSGTFTVASTGVYYFAVGATGNTVGSSPYLYFDDFFVEIPCSLNSFSVSIAASPSTSICVGQTATLSVNSPTGCTHSWYSGSTASSFTFTAAASTAYNWVISTSSLTSCTASANIYLTALPVPLITITGSQKICQGSALNLSASGGSVSTWITPTGTMSNPLTHTPITNAHYTVIVTHSNGCSSQGVATININPLPTLNFNTLSNFFCAGESTTLVCTGALVYDYGFGASQVFSVAVTPASSKIYTVTGSNSNNCSATATLAITVNPCTGIMEKEQQELKYRIYPNPASDFLIVESSGTVKLEVVNNLGQYVLSRVITTDVEQLSLHALPKGLYIVQLSSGEKTEFARLVVN